jgi:hypothetical protein
MALVTASAFCFSTPHHHAQCWPSMTTAAQRVDALRMVSAI